MGGPSRNPAPRAHLAGDEGCTRVTHVSDLLTKIPLRDFFLVLSWLVPAFFSFVLRDAQVPDYVRRLLLCSTPATGVFLARHAAVARRVQCVSLSRV